MGFFFKQHRFHHYGAPRHHFGTNSWEFTNIYDAIKLTVLYVGIMAVDIMDVMG